MAEYYSTAKHTDLERLMAKVSIQPNGCWHFTGSLDGKGYGNLFHKGRMDKAHKVSYSIHKGAVPKGLVLDHICHDPRWCDGGGTCPHRRCVNPDHLKPVTHKENMSAERCCHHFGKDNIPWAGVASSAENRKAKTHCRNGHEWTLENTQTRACFAKGRKYEYRSCRQCNIDRQSKKRLKLKSQYSSTPNFVA